MQDPVTPRRIGYCKCMKFYRFNLANLISYQIKSPFWFAADCDEQQNYGIKSKLNDRLVKSSKFYPF